MESLVWQDGDRKKFLDSLLRKNGLISLFQGSTRGFDIGRYIEKRRLGFTMPIERGYGLRGSKVATVNENAVEVFSDFKEMLPVLQKVYAEYDAICGVRSDVRLGRKSTEYGRKVS